MAYWLAFSALQSPGTERVLAGCGLGLVGDRYAMAADLRLWAASLLAHFAHGGWKHVNV